MTNNNEAYVWKLFAQAYEMNQVEDIRAEIKNMCLAFDVQSRFLEILKSPALVLEKKKECLKATFSDQVSSLLLDFLNILIEEDHLDELEEIAKRYDHIVSQYLEEQFNIVEGKVYSAIRLVDNQLEKIEHVFTEKLGKQVRLESIIDSSFIAGYKVEVQEHVYDATVGLQVQQLKASLKNLDLE